MSYEIKIENAGVIDALNEVLARTSDLTPAMQLIAAVMESAAEGAFANEADPVTGTPWEKLSNKTTIPLRMESGHWPGQILQRSGQLAASVETDYGDSWAAIGTNKPYAAMMFFGGKTSPRSAIPNQIIPARRFFGLSAADQEDVLKILRQYLDQ